jgi:hypothetical protein
VAAVVKLTILCPACGAPGCLLKTRPEDGAALVVHGVAAGGGSTATMTYCEVACWPPNAPVAGRDE